MTHITASDLESLFTSLFSGPADEVLPTIQQWFSASYVQVTDGHASNFDEFVAHINKLRSVVRKVSVEVLFLIQEENRVADRHIVKIEKLDGSEAIVEVLLLGERDTEGKFVNVWEASTTIAGDKDTKELARIR